MDILIESDAPIFNKINALPTPVLKLFVKLWINSKLENKDKGAAKVLVDLGVAEIRGKNLLIIRPNPNDFDSALIPDLTDELHRRDTTIVNERMARQRLGNKL